MASSSSWSTVKPPLYLVAGLHKLLFCEHMFPRAKCISSGACGLEDAEKVGYMIRECFVVEELVVDDSQEVL